MMTEKNWWEMSQQEIDETYPRYEAQHHSADYMGQGSVGYSSFNTFEEALEWCEGIRLHMDGMDCDMKRDPSQENVLVPYYAVAIFIACPTCGRQSQNTELITIKRKKAYGVL